MNVLAELVGKPRDPSVTEQLEQVLTRAATAPRLPPIVLCSRTGKGLVACTLRRPAA